MPTARAALNRWYHAEVKWPRVAALCAVTIIVALGCALPPVAVVRLNSRQDHRNAARLAATMLCGVVEEQIGQLYGALNQFRGFAASGAPLKVPRYFADNVSTRVNVAMSSGTPDALNVDGYYRILGRLNSTLFGYQNAVVQPGIVNVFAPDSSPTKNGDWLNYSSQVTAEYTYIATTTNDVMFGPEMALFTGVPRYTLAYRTGIFSDVNRLVRGNPGLVDPVTGIHPNWSYLWGGVAIVIDLDLLASQSADVLHSRASPAFHYLFESQPRQAELGYVTEYRALGATADAALFDDHDAIRECVVDAKFSFLCFRLIPQSTEYSWRGDDLTKALVTTAAMCILVPLLVCAMVLTLLRLVAGPKRDPLQFAPLKTPFHAVCIDMVAANTMWTDVPFVMNDVTTIFTKQLELMAKDHQVFIAARLGNSVLASSAHRHRIVNFTRAMCEWSHAYNWPPHIAMHCPQHSVVFSYVLHTCEAAVVRLEPSGPAGYTYDVTGPDIRALLFLRIAAIPGHIIATGHFLGVQHRDIADPETGLREGQLAKPNPLSTRTTSSSKAVSLNVDSLKVQARYLGICELPLPGGNGRRAFEVQGYLLESAATQDRALHDVMDCFPDWVWAEWKARVHNNDDDDDRDSGGVFSGGGSALVESLTQSSGRALGRNSNGSLTSSVAGRHRTVTTAHLNNTVASDVLPPCAVDLRDCYRLARTVLPLLTGTHSSVILFPDAFASSNVCAVETLRRYVSLASYLLVAIRVVFAPIDPDSRQSITAKICGSLGIQSTDQDIELAARCARVCQRYLSDMDPNVRSP
jgi:hypothetical protein